MGVNFRNPQYRKRPNPVFLIAAAVIIISILWFTLLRKPGAADLPAETEGRRTAGKTTLSPQPASNPDGERTDPYPPPVEPGLTADAEAAADTGAAPPNTGQMAQQAHALLTAGRYREALELYEKIRVQDRRVLTAMGCCYYGLQEYDNARSSLEQALKENGRDFTARKYLAYTLYRQDDLETSLEQAESALEIQKDPELLAFQNRLQKEMAVMEEDYRDQKLPQFKIQFSRFEHDESRLTVSGILKEVYREVGREMNFYPDQPVTVILYNDRDFFDVTRSPGWAGGIYDGKIRLPIKDITGKERELRRIIFHEYSHALIRALTPFCPMWLNEGLAEYFSLEDPVERIGQLIPLKNLENRFPADPRTVAVAYRESYSAVVYLIDKYGLYRIKELLEALAREKDIRRAFDSVLYTSYDRFLETWGRE